MGVPLGSYVWCVAEHEEHVAVWRGQVVAVISSSRLIDGRTVVSDVVVVKGETPSGDTFVQDLPRERVVTGFGDLNELLERCGQRIPSHARQTIVVDGWEATFEGEQLQGYGVEGFEVFSRQEQAWVFGRVHRKLGEWVFQATEPPLLIEGARFHEYLFRRCASPSPVAEEVVS